MTDPRRWTAERVATLTARYPHEDTAALAAELGVTYIAVKMRARKLGLRKSAAYLSAINGQADGRRAHLFKPGNDYAGYQRRYPELASLIQLRGVLTRQINKRKRIIP